MHYGPFYEGMDARRMGVPEHKNPYAAHRHKESIYGELYSSWLSGYAAGGSTDPEIVAAQNQSRDAWARSLYARRA